MNNKEKLLAYNDIVNDLKKVASNSIKGKKYKKAMAAISSCANIMYQINQVYMDIDLENMAIDMAEKLINNKQDYNAEPNTVMFYDGFGLDLRGLAVTQTRAIAACGYHLIYVTTKKAIGNIPHILKELEPYNVDIVYLNMEDYLDWTNGLNETFIKYKPRVAFFYTLPEDIVGTVIFNAYKEKVVRYQVDLTDHAFWLGAKCVDYIMESRNIGISNAIYHRKFQPAQIKILDVLTYINRDKYNKNDVIDLLKSKYIFSGGALYKTLGDKKLLFYKALEHILEKYQDFKYIYAGSGDSIQIELLQKKYPGRVFLIDERPDFFRYIENCVLYLNTYPMFGGMMMRYAALASKVPVTLRHDNDADGILFNQAELGIEFDSYDNFINEIDKLLTDENYRKSKEALVSEAIMTETVYKNNIRSLIEQNTTEFSLEMPDEIDTSQFRSEYINRINLNQTIMMAIANKRNKTLLYEYPLIFVKKAIKKVFG